MLSSCKVAGKDPRKTMALMMPSRKEMTESCETGMMGMMGMMGADL